MYVYVADMDSQGIGWCLDVALLGLAVGVCRCVLAMAEAEEVAKKLCTLCGLLHEPSAGRVHGTRFGCHGCLAADKQLRRGLGSKADLRTLEPEEQRKFFQRLHEEKKQQQGKAIPWITVRAELITTLCTKQVTSNETKVKTESLPLSVWLTRGWTREIVERCPVETDEALGTDLYKVPVKSQCWKEAYEEIRERILRQEKEASKKKSGKKKAGDGDAPDEEMDLPEPPKETGEKAAKTEKNDEKKALQLAKKTQGQNGKVAMTAAKAVGILSADLQAITKLKGKIQQDIPDGILETTTSSLETLTKWQAACKQALQVAEKPEILSGSEAQPVLAFDLNDVKMLHKTCLEVAKSLRPLLPEPKRKAKAAAAQKEDAGSSAAADAPESAVAAPPLPKRRKMKTPA